MSGNKLEQIELYRSSFERDNCGFGLIVQMDNTASHWLVNTAIQALTRLTHRGAIAADGKTGDGCGLLLKKPDGFLRGMAKQMGVRLSDTYAVGMVFLNPNPNLALTARRCLEKHLGSKGLQVLGWRKVPVDTRACGEEALRSLPGIEQVFVNAPKGMQDAAFSRLLYTARRLTEKELEATDPVFYVPSLSSSVIAYKGLIMPENLPVFYQELQDPQLASSLAIFHQRFSTNTLPEWRLCQPFRHLAHNGEINTIQGNRNWSLARGHKFHSAELNMEEVRPLVSMTGSDSNSLDNMLEALLAGGMDIFRAMRTLIPPAWQNTASMDPDLRAFYEFNSMHMEPWDGPAGIVLTDGRHAACTMDRNGLRPARWVITKDRHMTLASEVGVYDYLESDVVKKGRLKPGEMIAVDTRNGELLLPEAINTHLKNRHPYRQWMERHARVLESDTLRDVRAMSQNDFDIAQKQFQITFEERDQILRVLAEDAEEAVGSMGDDTPLPVLSSQIRSLFDYFRQQFAQVTNPPIDPLREQIVMSLATCIGRERNMFSESELHALRLKSATPVLSIAKFRELLSADGVDYPCQVIDLSYPQTSNLDTALADICQQAVNAVRNGKVILVLSDRQLSRNRVPVHALLAVGAVHHRLIEAGLRCDANLVVETGVARDPHHFAVLIGYGATAVFPYMAYECIMDLQRSGEITETDTIKLFRNYRKGINKGLLKIISKMGISTISSYRGAQLFESVGLHDSVVQRCFRGTTNRLQGTTFGILEAEQRSLCKQAWNHRYQINQGGLLKFTYKGEDHAYNPDVVQSLQTAVRSGDFADYRLFANLVDNRRVLAFRDMLKLRSDVTPIDLAQVEPSENILKRFNSAAMSLGALSPDAHETLAEAMNRLGAYSNSGEGGEDPARYHSIKRSRIKQVASGRFGVTPAYLRSADILQIKIAQGAKPGEGGQLPGKKVNELIARLRYCKPGVALISPPPHHDIYSIEDLAQLIFDLKQVNPKAQVSVKLVAEAGVGTIAAGVAKAYADLITISGHDGGTGASPLTSLRYAGSPWELGLTETHQILRANDLRDKVRLQTDGGLKTGLDVIKAAILGAESFGFGTAPMVSMGCKYLRICHLNNCATGVATQNNVLMGHFIGKAEMVMNYFRFVAEDTRQWLAKLGVKTLPDLIGRSDLLEIIEGQTDKQRALNLQPLLSDGGIPRDKPQYCQTERNAPFDKGELAEQMVVDCLAAIENRSGGEFSYKVSNINRSIGARLSGEIAQRHGDLGMEHHPIHLTLTGTAGQSFGVWNAGGLHMTLTGDANDYVGKGMAGGKLVVKPAANVQFNSFDTTIIGNTCLYGATGGRLYAAGLAGERFAVRNSGAIAVVEGIGDHGCEYMTGGIIAILGLCGINFGAGMTGGLAFVLDEDGRFESRCNLELVEVLQINTDRMDAYREYLFTLVEDFTRATGSKRGQSILDPFDDWINRFRLVKPKALSLESLLEDIALIKAA